MRNSRAAHISLLPTCSVGIVNKLNGCAQDALDRQLPIDYIIIAPQSSSALFYGFDAVKVEFVNGSSRFALRVAQFKRLRELLALYSGVVLRYPGADLGPFIVGCKLNNCIAEHHTLFIEEQNQTSPLRANVERFLGAIWLSCFRGHVAVTCQILDDVIGRAIFKRKFKIEKVLPNPYNFSGSYRSGVFRKKDVYVGVMSASSFMPWHGLDRVIEMFRAYNGARFKLVVVGNTTAAISAINDVGSMSNIEFVGLKSKPELDEIYNGCDFAFNSFGLDRLNMSVGSTLKLREYFDFSLPVISPLSDSGLPPIFKFLSLNAVTLGVVEEYLDSLDGTPFIDVKKAAELYLGVEAFNDAVLGLWSL